MNPLVRWRSKRQAGERGKGGKEAKGSGEKGGTLRAVWRHAREDVQVVCDKDPAVNSPFEVLLYPHLHALWLYRAAHALYLRDHRVAARAVSLFGRVVSGGIDIHPGARIGRRFFIDHGCGVVIGETVRIGDDVMLYHLVTLGSVGWWHDQTRGPGAKRHPTLDDGVVVGTGACVLGPVEIGANSVVGAKAVVMTSLPSDTRVRAGQVVPHGSENGSPRRAAPATTVNLRVADRRSTE
ncbi:serine O-acetyltransferase EpsC [Streptomyces sp. NPDC048644]|uniref:serine O-acetyltransferase EpsC n=1 Tax=Streptomyces sp. NPDC048644 TaxID=3365582 RepID=UPI0037214806